METTEQEEVAGKGEKHPQPVTVHVNRKPVHLPDSQVTGLEIKQAAIDQGVQIQLDWIVVEEADGGQPARQIGDDEEITVTDHSKFTVNDGDDDA